MNDRSGPGPRPDPILERRARISRLVTLGQRIGYSALGVAMVLFVVGFVVGFTSALTTAVLVLLVVACFVLPPAMVFGYGVRAADRHDAEERAREGVRRRPG
ncbi:MAG: hypothetical protein GEV08_20440 [Acidimicrobiia bacterium]|nr:hypothetical protein [Acidimicrobiia bacterium]